VETGGERDALVALGCRAFQGYLFARPMAEPEFRAWLAREPVTREPATRPAQPPPAVPAPARERLEAAPDS
jgi:predicted signal transduction protein with EAL and GGDEF domain